MVHFEQLLIMAAPSQSITMTCQFQSSQLYWNLKLSTYKVHSKFSFVSERERVVFIFKKDNLDMYACIEKTFIFNEAKAGHLI